MGTFRSLTETGTNLRYSVTRGSLLFKLEGPDWAGEPRTVPTLACRDIDGRREAGRAGLNFQGEPLHGAAKLLQQTAGLVEQMRNLGACSAKPGSHFSARQS